jgi:toxin ParE1/3/4
VPAYRLSRDAGASLDEIFDYTIERWGDAQADVYTDAIFAALERLAAEPGLGRRRADLPPTVLVHMVGGHLIVYRLGADDCVEVVNILHGAMDVARRITDALLRETTRR